MQSTDTESGDDAARRSPMTWLAVAGVPAAVAMVVHLGTLANGFVYDDPLALARGQEPVADLVGARNGLTYLTIRLDLWLWGSWDAGLHLTNVFLHGVATALVSVGALTLGAPMRAALVCGLLFAVHPVHVEAIASIENRKEILAMVFVMTTLIAWLSGRRRGLAETATVVAFACALAAKEVAAIGLVVLLPLGAAVRSSGRATAQLRRAAPLVLTGVLGALWYGSAALDQLPPQTRAPYADILASVAVSVPTIMRLLTFPASLSASYPAPTAPSLGEPAAWLGVAIVVLWLGAAWALRRRWPLAAFALAWTPVMYAPVSNVVPLTAFFVAERYLYVPSFGVCLLCALAIDRLHRQGSAAIRTAAAVAVAATIVAGGLRSYARVFDWHDAVSLWRSAARVFPEGSSKIHGELGFALVTAGQDAEAIPHLENAIAIGPAEGDFHTNLGLALWRLGRHDDAIAHMARGVEMLPGNQIIRFNLANALVQLQRIDEARPHLVHLTDPAAWTEIHPSVRAALATQGTTPARLRDSIARFLADTRAN